MKTYIVASLLAVGVLLRPQMAPSGKPAPADNNTTQIVAMNQDQSAPRMMTDAEMDQAEGGAWNFSCEGQIDTNGTSVWLTCCAQAWIFRVCIAVYVGEIPKALNL